MAWEALTKDDGSATEAMLLDRIRKSLVERGTLEVLRHGVEMVGLRATEPPPFPIVEVA